VVLPEFNAPLELTPAAPTDAPETDTRSQPPSENCARIRGLGFTASKRIRMYGEDFELVSDPFVEGDYTAINAFSRNDPTIRALRLPVSILVGVADRFRKLAGQATL
jgi:hypothetical protein